MARAAAGDRGAFRALIQQHQRPLFGFLGRLGLSQGEAEEIAQEAFLRAWQHLDRFDPRKAAFSTWLYTIAHRLGLHLLASADRRLRHHPSGPLHTEDDAPAAFEQADTQAGPLEALQARQQRAWLQAALHTLALPDRSVLALAYLHDLSLADLARIEGLSESAAKARLHRARQRLREALHKLDPDGHGHTSALTACPHPPSRPDGPHPP